MDDDDNVVCSTICMANAVWLVRSVAISEKFTLTYVLRAPYNAVCERARVCVMCNANECCLSTLHGHFLSTYF